MSALSPLPLTSVTLDAGFLAERARVNREVTLPIESEQMEKTGRFACVLQTWKEGAPNKPHIFYDSDIAKWIEAVAFSLATHPDDTLKAQVSKIIRQYSAAQQPDGYLNTYYTVVEPQNRWTNLADAHELYCAGHLMEAAVAWFDATGERQFLDIMERYAEHIAKTFGTGPGQKRGYPGHEEIELALIKLARATDNRKWIELASYFVNERGQSPSYFLLEAGREDTPQNRWPLADRQAHQPVREQETAEGHAVRACYLYTGMADVARETGDASLMTACKRIWRNIVDRRMYITGGIGSTAHGERFTHDYDLPNETAYAETCASIALMLFAHRMLHADLDGEYGDIMEKCLYNGVASGVSLSGDRFFYANPLSVNHAYREGAVKNNWWMKSVRQEWFGCACCPPNIARIYASLGLYAASASADTLAIHLYTQSTLNAHIAGAGVAARVTTNYPWDDSVAMAWSMAQDTAFTLALRIPAWCAGRASLAINGQPVDLAPVTRKGYAHITRTWKDGDMVTLSLPMDPVLMLAHPGVLAATGRVAIQRGPVVYCLESCDHHDVDIQRLAVKADAPLTSAYRPDLLGGCVVVEGTAILRDAPVSESNTPLYSPLPRSAREVPFRAVPYALWCNREPGDMQIWIPVA